MKHELVVRCAKGHETRVLYDERYSRDVVRAFGNFICGGEAIGVTTSDGEPIRWADETCAAPDDTRIVACGGAQGFEIVEVKS